MPQYLVDNLNPIPQLEIQRDIFVFQCLIGCRVGDLIKMTKANLINGAIEYIPRKTKEGRPLTIIIEEQGVKIGQSMVRI